jgi:hypothetical protein
MKSLAIEEALGELEAEATALRTRAAELQLELGDVKVKLERTQAAVNGLRSFLAPGDGSPEKAVAEPPAPDEPEQQDEAIRTKEPGGPDTVWSMVQRPQAKRFRSTQYVGDLLASDSRIWTFEEVVAAFKDDGKTATMQDPEKAIRTALGRATQKGLIVTVDDSHFRTAHRWIRPEVGSA